jgi:hypothetical protein
MVVIVVLTVIVYVVDSKLQEGIVQVTGNGGALAPVTDSGSVATLGSAALGGDSSSGAGTFQEDIFQMAGNGGVVVAVTDSGSVVICGRADLGYENSTVARLL